MMFSQVEEGALTPEEVFWKAIRDGYSYEAADAKRTRAELDEARREQQRES